MSSTASTSQIKNLLQGDKVRIIGAPVFILMILAMMTIPLPPFALDVLFTFNIAIGVMVLISSLYTKKPLDFAAFPTVLLLTTLLRLSLNVASTRVVLMDGHNGPDAAGKVIEAFGQFLVGGNLAVGIVVFAILVVINFVVITKGAGRIAEVAARFTLDAMPGKQMAIDADLNSGLIGEKEAKERRQEISQESEFYGAMDGASKFVRGDAVAGILILLINIVGGLAVGMAQHDLSFADASAKYVILAIGDGLVAQVPALVISIAAGLVVARVGKGEDVGSQLSKQLFGSYNAIGITAVVVTLLGLIPGMPNFVFLSAGLGLGYWAYNLYKKETAPKINEVEEGVEYDTELARSKLTTEATWEDVAPVEKMAIEVGYRLIPLVDERQDGDLIKRIKAIRKKFAQEIGFLPSSVHLRDNLELKASGYRILLKGVMVGEGEVHPSHLMAINSGKVTLQLSGIQCKDPAFGMDAVWINPDDKDAAQAAGYTIVEASTVIATHLSFILQEHAPDLLGRNETQALLDHYAKVTPKLVEDLTPEPLSVSTIQKVLQNLLQEDVHLRDMPTILETLIEFGENLKDPVALTSMVRVALGRSIVQGIESEIENDLSVLVLEPKLENIIAQSQANMGQNNIALDPEIAERLAENANKAAVKQEQLGQTPVLLVPDSIRTPMARMMKRASPNLRILSHSEIPESKQVKISQVVAAG